MGVCDRRRAKRIDLPPKTRSRVLAERLHDKLRAVGHLVDVGAVRYFTREYETRRGQINRDVPTKGDKENVASARERIIKFFQKWVNRKAVYVLLEKKKRVTYVHASSSMVQPPITLVRKKSEPEKAVSFGKLDYCV